MTRLVLAPKFTEGIEEKLLKLWSQKWGQKYLQKSQKWKILQLKIGDELTQIHRCIDANQEFTRCRNHPNILPLFGRSGKSLISLLSSLGGGRGILPQQPYGSIYSED
jgi:hypothetical protein